MFDGKARILIFSSSYLPVVGGVQTVAHSLAKQLILNGHEVRVATNRYPVSLPASETIDGVPVDRLLLLRPQTGQLRRRRPDLFLASLYFYPQSYWRLRNILREFRPNVINIHFADQQVSLVLKLRREFDFRLVVSLHGHDVERAVNGHTTGNGRDNPRAPKRVLSQLRAILAQADAVTAVSGNLLHKATKVEPTISNKSYVINNGIDPTRFEDKKSYQHPRPYILGLGRFVPNKGFDLLIQAFAECDREDKPDLIIAGSGEQRDILKAQVERLGLTGKIHFFGEASPGEVVQLLNGCLVVAVPSRSETFGIVALEGLAAGKPVLATRTGGLEEFLRQFEKENGTHATWQSNRKVILVDATVQGMADGLKQVCAISRNGSTLADNHHLPEKYTWTHVARSYERVLLGQRQQTGN